MRSSRFIIVLLSWLLCISSIGQSRNHREAVALAVNSRVLLTGEELLYTAFVNSTLSGMGSRLSSLLYIELVNDRDEAIHRAKIALENGRGSGDFFLPTTLSTGHYRLVAYTRWMHNFDDLTQLPMTIINPFEEYESPKLPAARNVTFFPEDGRVIRNVPTRVAFEIVDPNSTGIKCSGKLVNEKGESVADFASNELGKGSFSFVPKLEDYQVILEDGAGGVIFSDFIPVAAMGLVLRVEEKAKTLEVWIEGQSTHEVLTLSVHNINREIVRRQIVTGIKVPLQKSTLPDGNIYFQVLSPEEAVLANAAIQRNPGMIETVEDIGNYGPREQVMVNLTIPSGAYTVSVRKPDRIFGYSPLKMADQAIVKYSDDLFRPFAHNEERSNPENIELKRGSFPVYNTMRSVRYLPEYRKELVTGTVSTSNGEPLQGEVITFSIPDTIYQLSAGTTDAQGMFRFGFDPFPSQNRGYVALNDTSHIVTFDEKFLANYPRVRPFPVVLDSTQLSMVVNRSVRNQIENAYYHVKNDSILEAAMPLPHFDDIDRFYELDAYNRFPTMRDHFIEYIQLVRIRGQGTNSQFVISPEGLPGSERYDPLVLLDGLPVDGARALTYNPYKVASISVLNRRHYLGPLVVDGVLDIRTFDGGLNDFPIGKNIRSYTIEALARQKKYCFPVYGSEETSEKNSIPDFRDQLYWDPLLEVDESRNYPLEFSTSDTNGLFEIRIDGFTSDGVPYSMRRRFNVQ